MQSTWPPPQNQNPWQLGPSASRLARWVFGLGFFSVHLGIFLIGGLTLLMINLYRSPDDLWVGGPLLRWGVIVLIHFLGAVIAWAFTTAFDAAEATRRYTPPPARSLPVSSRSAALAPQRSSAQPPPTMMPPIETTPPRRRFSPARPSPARPTPAPTIEVDDRRRSQSQPSPAPSSSTTAHRASPPGWTVVKGDSEPASATPAADSDDADIAEDGRWTWVEAAAEAWLNGRNGAEKQASDETPSADRDSES